LVSRVFGAKADYYTARLAFFWALLAASPTVILSGLVKGFMGLGVVNSVVGALWFFIFLWILINCLIEAER
jgi:hypothetical protein